MKEAKTKKKYPRITIERVILNKAGHITAIDIHDEKFGEAIFFAEGSHHYHGYMNNGKCDE